MQMFELKCPYCGANLEVEDGLETFFCKYCGGKIILDGQSDEIVKAKVRMKELEQERYKLQFEAQEKEKARLREIEDNKDLFVGSIAIGIIVILFIIIFLVLSR